MELQRPAGPIANAYEQCRARVAACVGPTGGGKTTSSVKRCIRVAQWQDPSPRDGVRRARITCVGPTYRQLWKTAIPSYRETLRKMGLLTLPKDLNWKGSEGDPASHIFDLNYPPFGKLHIEVLFEAVNDEKLEDFVRGRETTAWWLPEMDTLPEDLIQLASNRVGRYPSPDDRPPADPNREPAYMGVYGDANVPDLDTWFYEKFWLAGHRPSHWAFFRQPDAYSPEAENMANLRRIDPKYYENMARDMDAWAIRRFLRCKPGHSRFGEPVHPDFDDERNVARETIPVDPYAPAVFGVDGGGNTNLPGVVLLQQSRGWQWKALAEFAPHTGTSAPEVGGEIKRILNTRVRRAKGAVIFIDPAAAIKSPLSPYTYAQQVQAASGVEVRLAPSQKPQDRRGALSGRGRPLATSHGGEPGFLVDPDCVNLIKCLAGGWSYKSKEKAKGQLLVEKSIHSHVGEGCEYGVLGGDGFDGFDNGLFGPGGEMSAADMPEPILA